MKIKQALFILITLTGCMKPKADQEQSSGQYETDSLIARPLTKAADDTLSFIGYIWKFEDNDLFYTDIYFVDNFNYDLYADIAKMGDQIVVQDEESRRVRIEFSRVQQYFDLSGLSRIDIYNDRSEKLSTGRLSHIEYVENMIETSFVAAYEVENPDITNPVFCVGNAGARLTELNVMSHDDDQLRSELIDMLAINTGSPANIQHYQVHDQAIYSLVSADTTAYIIETINNLHNILYKSTSSEAIDRITLVSLMINGKYVLLAQCSVPETDIGWTSLFVFNGNQYEAGKNQRIKRL